MLITAGPPCASKLIAPQPQMRLLRPFGHRHRCLALLRQHHTFDIFAYVQISKVAALDGCVVKDVNRGRVEAVSAALLDVDEAVDLAEMFRLLGDPTRVRILFALLEAGELCVCDIAAVVDTTDTKVSQAMRLLRSAGVVRNRRDGRNIYYRLDDGHVRMLLDLSREHLAHSEGVR